MLARTAGFVTRFLNHSRHPLNRLIHVILVASLVTPSWPTQIFALASANSRDGRETGSEANSLVQPLKLSGVDTDRPEPRTGERPSIQEVAPVTSFVPQAPVLFVENRGQWNAQSAGLKRQGIQFQVVGLENQAYFAADGIWLSILDPNPDETSPKAMGAAVATETATSTTEPSATPTDSPTETAPPSSDTAEPTTTTLPTATEIVATAEPTVTPTEVPASETTTPTQTATEPSTAEDLPTGVAAETEVVVDARQTAEPTATATLVDPTAADTSTLEPTQTAQSSDTATATIAPSFTASQTPRASETPTTSPTVSPTSAPTQTETAVSNLPTDPTPAAPNVHTHRRVNLRLSFAGANPNVVLEGFNPVDTTVSYFTGADPALWQTDVPVWTGVRYRDLYPGVNLEITVEDGQWVWRLVRQNRGRGPNVLDRIRLRLEGSDGLSLRGEAVGLATRFGELELPLIELDADDPELARARQSGPRIDKDEIQLPFKEAKRPKPGSQRSSIGLAMVRPETLERPLAQGGGADDLIYATLLGGSCAEFGMGVKADSNGAMYAAGYTCSTDFTDSVGYDQTANGNSDVFVAKINPNGTSLDYLTYVGGAGNDYGLDLAVDVNGSAFVTGRTFSTDFPTPNGFDTSFNGTGTNSFVLRLSAAGTALNYGSFIHEGQGHHIAVRPGAANVAYVVGQTPTGYPTTAGAFDTSFNSGSFDGFLAQVDTAGSGAGSLLYSTYLGGASTDCEYSGDFRECSVAVDSAGGVYVSGPTYSSNFPLLNAYSTSISGGEGFLLKLNPAGGGSSDLLYSTFFGVSSTDCYESCLVALDPTGKVYVAGSTASSATQATTGQRSYGGGDTDVYVFKFDLAQSGAGTLVYWTYLGGSATERVHALVVTSRGEPVIVGQVDGSFPVITGAFQTTFGGGTCGGGYVCRDAFMARLSATGLALQYATYLGGSNEDFGFGVALRVDQDDQVYVTGSANSSNFPLAGTPYDSQMNGTDAFVARFGLLAPVPGRSDDSETGPSTGGGNDNSGGSDNRECECYVPETNSDAGDPINTQSGEFSFTSVDLSIATAADSLAFQRTYASAATASYTTTLGYGWTHNQDVRLILPGDPLGEANTIWFKAHSANQYKFAITTVQSVTTYVPFDGVLASLVYADTPTPHYTLSTADQSVYTFDGTGRITQWTNDKGRSLNYAYTSGQLTQITEPITGRYLSIAYSGGRISSVSDHTGRDVQYSYSPTTGDLTGVTDVLGQSWTLVYSGTTHLLTDIVDPRSVTVVHTDYDAQGRGLCHMKVVTGGKKFLPGRRLDVWAEARILPKPDLSGGWGTKMGGGPAERGRSWRHPRTLVS